MIDARWIRTSGNATASTAAGYSSSETAMPIPIAARVTSVSSPSPPVRTPPGG